ncbi:PTS-dependent dihydroxyacetone kinase phosphotransferase subunit DhaM [Allostreptomyces psammosilenae]|uniref:Dihydroxyacetone kinase DhaKLM complex PTS-EIIA-like component DhaM n=1 Tax=Allostreptomyces psammosilenae TaxID=1892865 RepID=A0A852ZYQ5_9ACTN|nr:PTS fructose transporter subunit IIA [Allostreptomyces psammosilenae]NYI07476.1 dihydroxyacetone kinase DhaKLM complex PTS-EIIA-like component DhaM [Allostreptomyces psammosilenae]
MAGTAGGGPAPRVGVVLVSHSAAVAEAVGRLAAGMVSGAERVPLAAAGGDPRGGLGTDAAAIAGAIGAVARRVLGEPAGGEPAGGEPAGGGVAVLADLGSSVLTVRLLLEEPEELPLPAGLPAGAIRLVDAPFLEGAVAAVVTAATGAELRAVVEAAEEARAYRKK